LESIGTVPLILKLRVRWRLVVNAKAALNPERTPVTTEKEAGLAPEPVWKK
jgi:hypothetical protein